MTALLGNRNLLLKHIQWSKIVLLSADHLPVLAVARWMTHDYKRNGTTVLFAALSTLDGTVIGRCMPRHAHKEFLAFLKTVERSVSPGKIIHAITDTYTTHKQPDVLK